jgi:hypothetical protein
VVRNAVPLLTLAAVVAVFGFKIGLLTVLAGKRACRAGR